jgi:short-subunit dehydrogenase
MAERGHRVIATGRNQELLAALAEEAKRRSLPLTPARMDVTDDGAVQRVTQETLRDFGRIDALVNNAGYGLWGPIEELELDELRAVFETNLFAVVRVSQAVIPQMRERKSGAIVNIGSMAGQVTLPVNGAYSATKFALEAISRAMHMELAHAGIRVTLIEPGVFQTDFHKNVVIGRRVMQPGSPNRERTLRMRTRPPAENRLRADPKRVAMRIRQAIEAKGVKARYATGLDAHAGKYAARWAPDWVIDYVLMKALKW